MLGFRKGMSSGRPPTSTDSGLPRISLYGTTTERSRPRASPTEHSGGGAHACSCASDTFDWNVSQLCVFWKTVDTQLKSIVTKCGGSNGAPRGTPPRNTVFLVEQLLDLLPQHHLLPHAAHVVFICREMRTMKKQTTTFQACRRSSVSSPLMAA